MWVKKKFTPRRWLIILKIIYEHKISIHIMKGCFIPNHLVSFCVVCVHAWLNRRHCLRECKNRLAPKLLMWCLNKTLWIWVIIWSLQIQITSLTNLIMPHISNIEYQTSNNICARVCVWLCFCKKHSNAFHLIHSIHSLTPLIPTIYPT